MANEPDETLQANIYDLGRLPDGNTSGIELFLVKRVGAREVTGWLGLSIATGPPSNSFTPGPGLWPYHVLLPRCFLLYGASSAASISSISGKSVTEKTEYTTSM